MTIAGPTAELGFRESILVGGRGGSLTVRGLEGEWLRGRMPSQLEIRRIAPQLLSFSL